MNKVKEEDYCIRTIKCKDNKIYNSKFGRFIELKNQRDKVYHWDGEKYIAINKDYIIEDYITRYEIENADYKYYKTKFNNISTIDNKIIEKEKKLRENITENIWLSPVYGFISLTTGFITLDFIINRLDYNNWEDTCLAGVMGLAVLVAASGSVLTLNRILKDKKELRELYKRYNI